MADRDFIVKNGLVTGANNATFGTAVTLASNGNVGIGNTAPANKLVVAGSITATANVSAVSVNASTGFYGTVQTATQGTIDHNSLTNYSADRHIAHSGVSITAGTGLSGGGTIDASRTLNVTNVPNAVTFNNGGAGSASGTTFNGSYAITVSYNTVGAPSTTGTNASGTWSININGSAASLGGVAASGYALLSGATFTGDITTYRSAAPSTGVIFLGNTGRYLYFDGTNYIMPSSELFVNGVQVVKNSGTWSININGSAASATNAGYATSAGSAPNPNAITFNNGGAGAGSGNTYTGSATLTVSYNTIGAPSTTGTNASGTWSININGSAASATNASAATNATYATSAGSATLASKASTLSQGGGNGTAMTFNWSGQSGQPSWLWGGNDGTNMYVWNPANFSVNYATSAGSATNATNATNANYATSAGTAVGSRVLLHNQSYTNVSSIDLGSIFNNGSYQNFIVEIVQIKGTATASAFHLSSFNTSGGLLGTNNYQGGTVIAYTNNSVAGLRQQLTESAIALYYNLSVAPNASSAGIWGSIHFTRPRDGYGHINASIVLNMDSTWSAAAITNATVVNASHGFRLFFNAGNIASGTVRVYGVA